MRKLPQKKNVIIVLRLTEDEHKALARLARRVRMPKATVAASFIREMLELHKPVQL